MNDEEFETKYEEYKKHIRFRIRRVVEEEYNNYVHLAENVTSTKGLLFWAIVYVLLFLFGINLLKTAGSCESSLFCVIFSILGIILLLFGGFKFYILASSFNSILGGYIFFRSQYEKTVKKEVLYERQQEEQKIIREIYDYIFLLNRHFENIYLNNEHFIENNKDDWLTIETALDILSNLKKQYEELERYDKYADALNEDVFFISEMVKDLEGIDFPQFVKE